MNKSIIFRKIAFKVMFSISSTLFYGYDIIFELIKMIIRLKKQIIYNKNYIQTKMIIAIILLIMPKVIIITKKIMFKIII